jgi:hypothetical protein
MSDQHDAHVSAMLRQRIADIEANLEEIRANLMPSKPSWLEQKEAIQADLSQLDEMWDDLIETRRQLAIMVKAANECLLMEVGNTATGYLMKKALNTALAEVEQ